MIVTICASDRERMDNLVGKYYEQIDLAIITPELIEDITPQDRSTDDDFAMAKIEEKFYGIMFYHNLPLGILDKPVSNYIIGANLSGRTLPESMTFRDIDDMIMYDPSRRLVEIGALESFVKGTGRELVQALKSKPDIGAIFTNSLPNAVGFYKKMGFTETGIYSLGDSVMVWTPHIL